MSRSAMVLVWWILMLALAGGVFPAEADGRGNIEARSVRDLTLVTTDNVDVSPQIKSILTAFLEGHRFPFASDMKRAEVSLVADPGYLGTDCFAFEASAMPEATVRYCLVTPAPRLLTGTDESYDLGLAMIACKDECKHEVQLKAMGRFASDGSVVMSPEWRYAELEYLTDEEPPHGKMAMSVGQPPFMRDVNRGELLERYILERVRTGHVNRDE